MPVETHSNGRLYIRFSVDGKDYRYSTGLLASRPNKRLANALEAKHRAAIIEGRNWSPKIQARTLNDAANEFLKWSWAQSEQSGHRETARRHKTSFSSLRDSFNARLVAGITPGDVEAYKTKRLTVNEVAGVTLRHDLHALRKFFQWCRRMNYTRENPMTAVEIPSDAAAVRERILSPAEERAYFAAALAKSRNLHDLGRLVLLQGLRPDCEALCLRKDDVDIERGVLHVRKSKSKASERTLVLTSEARSILAERIADPANKSAYIFGSKRTTTGHMTHLRTVHELVLDTLAFRFVIYDLRHTFATRLAAAAPLQVVAKILGHANLRSVMRYVHTSADDTRRAMEQYEQRLQAEKQEGAVQ